MISKMFEEKEYCYFCGSELFDKDNKVKEKYEVFEELFVTCPLCGTYHIKEKDSNLFFKYKDETAYYLYNHKYVNPNLYYKNRSYSKLISKKEKINNNKQKSNHISYVFIDDIKAFYPRKFSEKIENCILALISKAEMPGKDIEISNEELATICCVKRNYKSNGAFDYDNCYMQIKAILTYLRELDYIDKDSLNSVYKAKFELKPKLWLKAEQLQLNDKNNKNVFIAMSFNNTDDLKSIRNAIEKAISDTKFDSKIMDNIIHNEQIVPYMLKLIRDSRFMIMESTYPNMGAYFEAGYAEGLGKQVIVCCRKKEFDNQINNTDPKKEKSIHFDIAQKQLLIWKDYNDLTKQLKEWIEALF